jgi:Tfp pilus assembly protein PilF
MRAAPGALHAAVLLLALACAVAHAAPFTPKSDAEVVERLPAAADPAVRGVESMRRQLAAQPANTDLRLQLAHRYFDLAMAQGDPRYVGYATAALEPLGQSAAGDARYWLVRGLLQQYRHDFDGALASLRKASEIDPSAVEPIAWRSAIHMVQARYADALEECNRLVPVATPLYAQGCAAYVRGSAGQLQGAYEELSRALASTPDVPPPLALWQHTRLAEMATRLQRWERAEAHFKAALATGITDQFLLAAYADFLLLRNRPKEVLTLLAGWERSDVLLLRLAIAADVLKDARAAAWARELRERFREAAARGDGLHEQEAARFALDVEGNLTAALKLARSNYEKQKEPRDAEVLMRAALGARQAKAAQPAVDWLRTSRYEDPRLQTLAEHLVLIGAER